MAQQSDQFVRLGAKVFMVLAWVAVVFQVISGGALVILGGPPVAIGDAEIPARVIGLLNFVAAAVYWFLFMFLSHAAKLLLDVHAHAGGSGSAQHG